MFYKTSRIYKIFVFLKTEFYFNNESFYENWIKKFITDN